MSENTIREAAEAFDFPGTLKDIQPCGGGHINYTYKVTRDTESGEAYFILQKINTGIFRDPGAVMRNITGVTEFLRKKIAENGGDPDRETLTLVPCKTGGYLYRTADESCFRAFRFITGATCYEQVEKPEHFYQSGRGFGRFQRQLADYPAEELTETLPDFHNTPKRYRDFCRAVEQDVCGRAAGVQDEIHFIQERAEEYGAVWNMWQAGELPVRVTHNDTKLSNVMIDDMTGEAVCVIDLDTVMPGMSVFDYGDSIRFGANTAAEDETDLEKVSLSLELLEQYTKGFLLECGGSLTENEIAMLPMGAKLMTLECGMRFLADYLEGDVYYQIARENHNLDRARTQIALTADMECKWEEMRRIVRECVDL